MHPNLVSFHFVIFTESEYNVYHCKNLLTYKTRYCVRPGIFLRFFEIENQNFRSFKENEAWTTLEVSERVLRS
jgi:hypothetical protein